MIAVAASTTPVLVIVSSVCAAAIAAMGAWLAARRSTSGDIRTSSPEILWGKLEGILDERTREAAELRVRATELGHRIDTLSSEADDLRDHIERYAHSELELERRITRCESTMERYVAAFGPLPT